MRVLLHTCCGPCLIEPLEALQADHSVGVFLGNPNIHPLAEHERRSQVVREYARARGVELVEASYEPERWVDAVSGGAADPETRCPECLSLRLGLAAGKAAELGYDAIATTLTVSPYQDQAAVARAGRQAAEAAGVSYLDADHRDRYQRATARSKELGMYRQRYCGCVVSEVEAERSRGKAG